MPNESKFLKPQAPLMRGADYVLPVTTADQIILEGGQRLEQNGKIIADIAKNGVPNGGTAGQVLYKKSDANQDVEWKDPSGGVEIKLLWENAVIGTFAAQTISLDLAENDLVMVLYRDYYSNDQAISQILVKNHRAILTLPVNVSNNTRIAERIMEALDDGVHFEDCNAMFINSGSKSVSNSLLFPLQIYGIKGVQV